MFLVNEEEFAAPSNSLILSSSENVNLKLFYFFKEPQDMGKHN
jgi:hypothetical protein